MYSEYLKERLGFDTYKNECGFITYKKVEEILFINDVFVIPSQRKSTAFLSLYKKINQIAKELDCTVLQCQVWSNTNCSTNSLKAVLGAGFNFVACTNQFIVLEKEVY